MAATEGNEWPVICEIHSRNPPSVDQCSGTLVEFQVKSRSRNGTAAGDKSALIVAILYASPSQCWLHIYTGASEYLVEDRLDDVAERLVGDYDPR